MSLTPKQQLEQVNNPNLLSILSTIQGLPTQESLKHGAYVWKKLTADGGDFIDFVVSDSETAYPDGGLQGGYWYEKVVEGVDLLAATGCTKVAVDKFTPTSISSDRRLTVSHSLGTLPQYTLVFSETENNYGIRLHVIVPQAPNKTSGSHYYSYASFKYQDGYIYYGNMGNQDGGTPFNDQQIILQGTTDCMFEVGVEYTMITMA